MNIVSLDWAAWMVATTAAYWCAPREHRDLVLIAATLAFLVAYSPISAAILGALIVLLFYATRMSEVSANVVIAAIAALLFVFVAFKANSVPHLTTSRAIGSAVAPIGLAYYVLRATHYAIERYKDKLEPHTLRQFAGYMLFLPAIAYGPVHRFPAYLRDARRVRWDSKRFAAGLERVLYGYAKVAFVANFLMVEFLSNLIRPLELDHIQLASYLTVLRKGFTVYILFSGYSDVAIGFALLCGFRIIENFNWPLLARNISQFWQRWHMSVSSWCREYVYLTIISLTRRPMSAAIVAVLVLALWHELSYRHLLWGLYNAIGIAAWQLFQRCKLHPVFVGLTPARSPILGRAMTGLAILLTVHFVLFGFVIVEEESLRDVLKVYERTLGWQP